MQTPSKRISLRCTLFPVAFTDLPCGILALVSCLVASPLQAGGHLLTGSTSQEFASHDACLAEIERLAAEDRRQISPRETTADGAREVRLTTTGLQRSAPQTLRYEATIWFEHERMRQDLGQREMSHSFDRVTRICQGATLTMRSEKGFTLSTFELNNAGKSEQR